MAWRVESRGKPLFNHLTTNRIMKEITLDTQKILDTLKKVATDTLERKRRLGEYAVVWQDNKPVIIGDMLEDSDDDFRRETSLL